MKPRTAASFLAELKRRRVARTALVYLAGAFATLQAADVLVPALYLPGWIVTAIAAVLIAGLPLALALAWLFDITPEGVRRAAPAATDGSAPWVGRRTIATTAILLIFGGGVGAGLFLRPAPAPAVDEGPAIVAVLPFSNLSGDAATDPFVMGVHDDLLTQLSRLGALRVISRTSVLEYRDSPKNIRLIAQELGARAVLEGGVQRSGDRVRLNVQLIDAQTDAHLWAETYERALTAENIFAIQSEIARSIAEALQAELAPAERLALDATPTANLEALDAYHAGRDAMNSLDRRPVAAQLLERAVELDPQFAEAWAALSTARSWGVRSGFGPAAATVSDSTHALQALERARSLAPRSAATRLAEAYFHYYARADLPRARAAFQGVLEDSPGDVEALLGLAAVERRLGFLHGAVPRFREAVRLDPRNPRPLGELGWTLVFTGDIHGARPLLERALLLRPDNAEAATTLFALLLWELGDVNAAELFAARSPLAAQRYGGTWRGELALVRRDYAAAARAAADAGTRPVIFGYGTYYSAGTPLLAKLAWLAGDRAAVQHWTAATLAVADTIAARAIDDRWAFQTQVQLLRALAFGFRGDTARALAAAREAARFPLQRDAITATAILDHLVVVDIITGRHEEAMDGIERLLGMPSLMRPTRLRLDPIYDPLRGYPRFRALAGLDS